MTVDLRHGDCLDVLRELADNSVDAIVTDPPYGLANTTAAQVAETITHWVSGDRTYIPSGKGFMGKSWDAFVPPAAVWDECFRVLKPGGHLLSFAGARTQDLMGLGIRLAGFEIRDSVAWLTGSGFPKSLDVSKAIDKAAGAEREVTGHRKSAFTEAGSGIGGQTRAHQSGQGYRPEGEKYPSEASVDENGYKLIPLTAPATEAARQWQGWGTSLKPGHEPCVVARKPLGGVREVKLTVAVLNEWEVRGCDHA